MKPGAKQEAEWTRRKFLATGAIGTAGGLLVYAGFERIHALYEDGKRADVCVAKAGDYGKPLKTIILDGMAALGVGAADVSGKRILLKPNFVEPEPNRPQIVTHPLVVHAAAEAFLSLGAAEVLVAEAAGHRRDTVLILETAGMADVLRDAKIRFIDLNYVDTVAVPNTAGCSAMRTFEVPKLLRSVDWIVSMPKMKTHHWAGVTLSMKNLFGAMPGCVYGWPKNVFHHLGIDNCILDLNAMLQPHFAIVDGIVGMEGDGPIMGDAKHAGLLVMGKNLPAVDATCARLMGVNPLKVPHLKQASGWLGPIREEHIAQRGENIRDVAVKFALLDKVPAQRGIRL
ncbi:MAG: DUF362 domain-containing protein [Methylacidiphilales bacterium]|nr:DUF362 domain-containing protein [Candidatus Methylacidiphilales bacterium]